MGNKNIFLHTYIVCDDVYIDIFLNFAKILCAGALKCDRTIN